MIQQPIIRFEVEHLKHCIVHAFSEYALQFDKDVKGAIERFCQPQNIQRIMDAAVEKTMRDVINAEIETFFKYGNGREVVKRIINRKLEESYL
jgi:hypothetical protein